MLGNPFHTYKLCGISGLDNLAPGYHCILGTLPATLLTGVIRQQFPKAARFSRAW